MKRFLQLIGCIGISFAAGVIGSLATVSNIPTWYAGLEKPPYLPPNEVFGPVWTVLYTRIGVALFLVVRSESSASKSKAYLWFGVQLVLNTLWSLAFFGLHQPWLAFVIIIALLGVIALTFRQFHAHTRSGAYLLAPYFLWCCFAAYLNLGVAVLN